MSTKETVLRRHPRIRFLIPVLTVGLGLIAGVVISELILRIAGIGSDQFLRADPVLGVRFIASKTGLSQGECYQARVSTSVDGWRNSGAASGNPDAADRVLVVGDSFMAALQVNDDETFSSVLERMLNHQTSHRQVEVMNFGVPSWGTDQEYLAIREYGLKLKPKLVLLAFYAQNDISDNSSALSSRASIYPKPFFELRNSQLVKPDFHDPTPAVIDLARRGGASFRLYPLVRDSLLQFHLTHRLLYALGIVAVVPNKASAVAHAATVWEGPERWKGQVGVFERHYSDEWIQAWSITEAILAKARDDVDRSGAKFLLMELPSPIAVMPRSLRAKLVGDARMDELDVDKPGKLLEEIARRKNIELVSLTPAFRERIGDSEADFAKHYLSCDGHWTRAGHQLAAQLIAPEVTGRISPIAH